MKFDWLLFDLDNTLLDFSKSAKVGFVQTLEYFQINNEPTHYAIYKQVNDMVWKEFEQQKITALELRSKRFELFLNAIGEYREPLEMNSIYLKMLSETTFFVDGARELLQRLKNQKINLAIITNGLKEVQRPRLQRAELTPLFDEIVVSDEIGHAKPHAPFFEYTHAKIKYPAKDRLLVIGDNLNSDIKGGNDFGLTTCWFNPHLSPNTSSVQPTYEIQKLSDLWKLLEN